MAHFYELKDESDISKVKLPQGCRNDGLRSLFDQVLSYFLKRVCVNQDLIWVFPPKLSDGVEADLYTLFWVVRKMGSYELVSKNDLWECVVKECGLDIKHVGSLKHIYVKYLKELDQWLTHGGLKDMELDNGDVGVLEKLDSLFRELNGCKYSSSFVGFEHDEKGKCVVLESSNVGSQKKRKGESLALSRMLNWVANVARNPHDVTIKSVPSSSKWHKYKGNEVWKQVLLVKDALFAKRNVHSCNKAYVSQKKRHIMHPSMYEDDRIPIRLSSKRMRCSQRVSSTKSCSCPGCKSCSSSQNKRVKNTPQILEPVARQNDTCEEDQETESAVNVVVAEVPEWTGVIYESDPKWLGTRMWPPPHNKNGKHEAGVIGKGRQSSCPCLVPGSADCVRFHIAENRTKVKHTLGQLFYIWKFHHMGEDAALCSWSIEEESEFKSLVIKARQELGDESKSRHEIMSNFWRRASESFPFKTKAILVSYYFNVFVLRRRSYQNRVMPDNIDSDDDEQDVGHEKIDAPRLHSA